MLKIRQRIAKELQNGCLFYDEPAFDALYSTSYVSCNLDEPSSGSECQSDASDLEDFEKTEEQLPKAKASSTESEFEDDAAVPRTWNNLHPDLQSVLPPNDKFTYLVESYKKLPKLTFCGAPEANFEAHLRVNLDDENQAKEWIEALSKQSKCTYNIHCYSYIKAFP